MSMLSKTVSPKTKVELIRALQAATFRTVKVYEITTGGTRVKIDALLLGGDSVIIVR